MAHRTFLALDLEPATVDRIVRAAGRIEPGPLLIRWVRRENLHVTLKFLGDVDDDLLVDVFERVARAAEAVKAFDYDVRGVSAVPPRGPLRMLWVNVHDVTGRMSALYDDLDKSLAGLRIRQENRPFAPHVTLARVKSAGDARIARASAARLSDEDFGVVHADEVVAYSSQTTSEGSIYTPLARMPLG